MQRSCSLLITKMPSSRALLLSLITRICFPGYNILKWPLSTFSCGFDIVGVLIQAAQKRLKRSFCTRRLRFHALHIKADRRLTFRIFHSSISLHSPTTITSLICEKVGHCGSSFPSYSALYLTPQIGFQWLAAAHLGSHRWDVAKLGILRRPAIVLKRNYSGSTNVGEKWNKTYGVWNTSDPQIPLKMVYFVGASGFRRFSIFKCQNPVRHSPALPLVVVAQLWVSVPCLLQKVSLVSDWLHKQVYWPTIKVSRESGVNWQSLRPPPNYKVIPNKCKCW